MKIKLRLLSTIMMLCLVVTNAQVKKTPTSYKVPQSDKILNTKSISKNSFKEKETMVVYVIDNKTEKLSQIVLYEAFKNDYRETKLKKYKNSSFLTGYLKGNYQEKDGQLMVSKGSSLIIIKDKNASLFDKSSPVHIDIPKEELYTGKFKFIPEEEFLQGDDMSINLIDGRYGYGRPPMPYWDKLKVEIIKNDKNQAILKVL